MVVSNYFCEKKKLFKMGLTFYLALVKINSKIYQAQKKLKL